MQFDVPTVFWGGLCDGFSPEALVTLAFFVFFLGLAWRWGQNLLVVGVPFILMVFSTYFCEGLGFLRTFVPFSFSPFLSGVGYLAGVLLGLLSGILILYDVGTWISRPVSPARSKHAGKLEGEPSQAIGKRGPTLGFVVSVIAAGSVFPLVELNSTSGRGWPLIPVPIFYLGVYCLAFTIPLVLVLVSIYFVQKMSWWQALVDRHASTMRLVVGAGFVVLALWLGWQGRYWLHRL